MKKPFIVIFIIAVALIAALILYGIQKNQKDVQSESQNAQQSNEVQNKTAEQKTIDKANWKQYKNTEFGFGFSYPQELLVAVSGPSNVNVENSDSVSVFGDSNAIVTFGVRSARLAQNSDSQAKNVWMLSLKDYANKIWSGNKNDASEYVKDKQVSDLKEIEINNRTAYTFTLTGSYEGEDVQGGYLLNEPTVYVFAGNDVEKIQISYAQGDTTAEAIVASLTGL